MLELNISGVLELSLKFVTVLQPPTYRGYKYELPHLTVSFHFLKLTYEF